VSGVYVIMVTAKADWSTRWSGLGRCRRLHYEAVLGAVVARVKTILRRARTTMPAETEGRIVVGDLVVDTARREVTRDGTPVELTTLEFDLLHALARSPGRVFTRRQLLEQVWGWDFYGDERVVDVHVRAIRRALGDSADDPEVVATVRGVGYKLLAGAP
jgi:DNA-binding response OmpR family regulator